MEHKKRNRKKNIAAFTLGEFLAVIAIVSILASLSFVAVIHYQRKLRRLEMDQTAKEIFLAAQNHLTLEKSSGTFERLLNMDAEEPLDGDVKLQKLGIEIQGSSSYAVLYAPGKSDEENKTEEIRNRLLPFGSIDETIRENGSYIIFYEPETGLVREVWYSDGYEFVQDDIGSEALKSAASDAGKRETFTGVNSALIDKKFAIGHYASETLDSPEVIPTVQLTAPVVKLINDDILYVEIKDENQTEHILRLFVQGEKSGTVGYIDVNSASTSRSKRVSKTTGSESDKDGTYVVILDDITAYDTEASGKNSSSGAKAGFKFMDFNLSTQTDMVLQKDSRGFTDKFIPGENIYVYAQALSNQTYSSVETSNTSSGNSLFASVDTNRGAVISSFRHLENLDARVSGFEPDELYGAGKSVSSDSLSGSVGTQGNGTSDMSDTSSDSKTVTAMQLKSLNWKSGSDSGDISGYCGHVAKLHENFANSALNKDASTISITYRIDLNSDNPDKTNVSYTEKSTKAGSYLPIEPDYPMIYRGNTKRIDNLQVGENSDSASNAVSDITDRITGKHILSVDGAGGLFGNISSDLEVRDLLICEPLIHVNENAGAVIGQVSPNTTTEGGSSVTNYPSVKIRNVDVEYPNIQAEENDAAAGAAVGSFEGKSLTIEKTIVENHFREKLDSKALNDNGSSDLDEKTEATYRVCAAKGTAGGLVGDAIIHSKDAQFKIVNSTSSIYVEGKNAGGLLGSVTKASDVSNSSASGTQYGQGTQVQIANCYVGGHTDDALYDAAQVPGTGTDAAYKDFRNICGRYNIAAYDVSDKNADTSYSISAGGIAGGLAAQLPKDASISCVYVSASVYSPAAALGEENTEDTAQSDTADDENSTAVKGTDTYDKDGAYTGKTVEIKEEVSVNAAAFVACYEDGEAGKLPSDTLSGADASNLQSIYPSTYVSGKVNDSYVVDYAVELKTLFSDENTDSQGEAGTTENTGTQGEDSLDKVDLSGADAYPYDALLKKSVKTDAPAKYPMPTVSEIAKIYAGTDASKIKAAEKLPWFLQSHTGDWVRVVKKAGEEPDVPEDPDTPGFKMENGNRLYTEYISEQTVADFAKYNTDRDGWIYMTYCITGETSKNKVYYTLAFKYNNGQISDCYYIRSDDDSPYFDHHGGYQRDWWHNCNEDGAHRFEVGQTEDGRLKIRFYLDNRTFQTSNFMSLDPFWNGHSDRQFINGENISVKIAEPGQNINASNLPTVSGNSLFESVEKIEGTANQYTAYISNSRHLLNLGTVNDRYYGGDYYKSIIVTHAVQTDNILWKNDDSVSAKTSPYSEEIAGAYPSTGMQVWYNYVDGNGGKNITTEFVPIDNPALISYDGQQHIISKLRVANSEWDGLALFKKTTKMTISNLNMKDTVIESNGHPAAVLVAKAEKINDRVQNDGSYLTLNNIHIYGDETKVSGTVNTGAVVGQASGTDLKLKNVLVEGDNLQIKGGWSGTGGLIGYTDSDNLTIDKSYVKGKNLLISSNGGYAGGLIGHAGGNSGIGKKMQISNCFFSGYVSSTGECAGGLIGNLATNSSFGPDNDSEAYSITNCYVAGRNSSYQDTGNAAQNAADNSQTIVSAKYAGGLAGTVTGTLTVSKTFSNADVYVNGTNAMVGGMIGAYDEVNSRGLKLSSCYITGKVDSNGPSVFAGTYIGQLNNTWSYDQNSAVNVEGISVTDECRYIAQSGVNIIGMPGVNTYAKITATGSDGLVSLTVSGTDNAEQTIPTDDALAENTYPYPIWTSFEPTDDKSGIRQYVGDWK